MLPQGKGTWIWKMPHLWMNCLFKMFFIHFISISFPLCMWGFPQMRVPPVIVHLNRIFPYKPSSYWGTAIYGHPHMGMMDDYWNTMVYR